MKPETLLQQLQHIRSGLTRGLFVLLILASALSGQALGREPESAVAAPAEIRAEDVAFWVSIPLCFAGVAAVAVLLVKPKGYRPTGDASTTDPENPPSIERTSGSLNSDEIDQFQRWDQLFDAWIAAQRARLNEFKLPQIPLGMGGCSFTERYGYCLGGVLAIVGGPIIGILSLVVGGKALGPKFGPMFGGVLIFIWFATVREVWRIAADLFRCAFRINVGDVFWREAQRLAKLGNAEAAITCYCETLMQPSEWRSWRWMSHQALIQGAIGVLAVGRHNGGNERLSAVLADLIFVKAYSRLESTTPLGGTATSDKAFMWLNEVLRETASDSGNLQDFAHAVIKFGSRFPPRGIRLTLEKCRQRLQARAPLAASCVATEIVDRFGDSMPTMKCVVGDHDMPDCIIRAPLTHQVFWCPNCQRNLCYSHRGKKSWLFWKKCPKCGGAAEERPAIMWAFCLPENYIDTRKKGEIGIKAAGL